MSFFTCSKSKEVYKFSMFCFSLLVNSTNLELIIGYLKSFYIIFGSEFADKMVNKNYSKVKESFKCIG